MKILGASIETLVDSFLHAGYGSVAPPAPPGPLSPADVWLDEVPNLINVARALEIDGGGAAAKTAGAETAGLLGGGGPETLLAGAVLFFVGLLLVQIFQNTPRGSPRLRRGGLGLVAATLGLLAAGFSPVTVTEPPPWADVERQTYVRPKRATEVIMHGILAPAIIGTGHAVNGTPELLPEIGLPARQPTPGMAYALATFGLDGWGNAIDIDCRPHACTLTSAGRDGRLRNADDLQAVVYLTPAQWRSSATNAFFLGQEDGRPVALFHRWPTSNFRARHPERAQALTGGPLFDLLELEALTFRGSAVYLSRAYRRVAAEREASPPLLVVLRNL